MKKIIVLIFMILSVDAFSALNESVCGALVVTQVKLINPGLTGAAEAEAITMWTAVCKGIITHIKTAADINLLAGDIPVPSTGLISALPGSPVTGSANSGAALLLMRIQ